MIIKNKKIIPYFLTLILLIGIFAFVPAGQARAIVTAPGWCDNGNGTVTSGVLQSACPNPPNQWTSAQPVNGWCTLSNGSVNGGWTSYDCSFQSGSKWSSTSTPAAVQTPTGAPLTTGGNCSYSILGVTRTVSEPDAATCTSAWGPGAKFSPTGSGMCTSQDANGNNLPSGCSPSANVPGSYCVVTNTFVGATTGATLGIVSSPFQTACGKNGGTYFNPGTFSYAMCTIQNWSPQSCAEASGWGSPAYTPPAAVKTAVINNQLGSCTFSDGTVGQNYKESDCENGSNPGTWTAYYNLLAPLPACTSGTNGCVNGQLTSFDPSQTNNLSVYLNLAINIFIGICAVLAVIMILWGGIEYMTSELISNKEAGKERIRNALLGLILALGSWAILYTVNPNILNTNLSSLTPQTVQVDLESDVPQTPVNGKYADGAGFAGGGVDGAAWPDTDQSLPYSDKNGLVASIYNLECATIGQPSCTSSEGLSLANIDNIEANCGKACLPLSISGGTEYWLHGQHSGNTSHKPGSPTIDIIPTSALTAYIMTGDPTGNTPFTPPGYFTRHKMNGVSYLWENNHWHAGP